MRMHTAGNQRMWRDSLLDCITAMCSWIRSQQWSIQLPIVCVPHICPPLKQSNASEIGEGTFTCIYNWFCLKTYTIYNTLNILPSGIWIQSFNLKRPKGAELRVLIVFSYYAILGVSILTAFCISSRSLQGYSNALHAYFLCERNGTGAECDRSGFESFTNPALVTIGNILVGPVI